MKDVELFKKDGSDFNVAYEYGIGFQQYLIKR